MWELVLYPSILVFFGFVLFAISLINTKFASPLFIFGIAVWFGALILTIYNISDIEGWSTIPFLLLFIHMLLLLSFGLNREVTIKYLVRPDPKGNSPSPLREMRFDVA
tara:strand:- start:9673 stop:9996 length:324 start_codon:yes stop_codon:yes gene_type:complete